MLGTLRFIMTAIGLILIGIGVVGMLVLTQGNDFVCAELETRLSRLFGTKATIEELGVEWLDGAIALRGVTLENPEQFKEGPAVEIEEVVVAFNAATIFAPNPVIERLATKGTLINLRYQIGKGTNVGALLKHAQEAGAEATGVPGVFHREVIVQRVDCQEAKVKLKNLILPTPPATLNVAPFTIEEVDASNPVRAGKVAAIFLRSVAREAITLKGMLGPVKNLLERDLA